MEKSEVIKYSDLLLGKVGKEEAERILSNQPFKNKIDEEIKPVIDEINKHKFVKTLTSCAGHENSFWDTPYIILAFSNEGLEEYFIKVLSNFLEHLTGQVPRQALELCKAAIKKLIVRRIPGEAVVCRNDSGEVIGYYEGRTAVEVAAICDEDWLDVARAILFDAVVGLVRGMEKGLRKLEEGGKIHA